MKDMVIDEEIRNTEEKKEEIPANLPILDEMVKAGLFLGHKKSKTHPRMKPYIFGVRNGMDIFDLTKILKGIDEATAFLKTVVAQKGVILFVGTTPAARTVVGEVAGRLHMPYVNERWLGGTLTNFRTLSKRIGYFKKQRADREAGRFAKYTKKEKLEIDREIAKLTTKFTGIETMETLPAALFVVDLAQHMIAVREAHRVGIPVIAIGNSNADPLTAQYLIPANDRSTSGLTWILTRIESAVNEARTTTTQQA